MVHMLINLAIRGAVVIYLRETKINCITVLSVFFMCTIALWGQ